MPTAPPRPCRQPGCPALVRSGYCDTHRPAAEARRQAALARAGKRYDRERRDPGDRFYASSAWRGLRDRFIRSHPLCEECEKEGRLVPAKIADHRIPRKERPDLSLDEGNLRALCRPCHNRHGRQVRQVRRG